MPTLSTIKNKEQARAKYAWECVIKIDEKHKNKIT